MFPIPEEGKLHAQFDVFCFIYPNNILSCRSCFRVCKHNTQIIAIGFAPICLFILSQEKQNNINTNNNKYIKCIIDEQRQRPDIAMI